MRRFGLPVTTFTFAILIASALSWNDAVHNPSFIDNAKAYVAASDNGTSNPSEGTVFPQENGSTLTLPPVGATVVDGATVTADLSDTPWVPGSEDVFVYVLLAVSLYFVVSGIRKTIRTARTRSDN